MVSIRSNDYIPITDKFWGDDVDKAIKTAEKTYRIKRSHMSGQCISTNVLDATGLSWDEEGGGEGRGQTSPWHNQQGSFHGLRAKGKAWNQKRTGKLRGKSQ